MNLLFGKISGNEDTTSFDRLTAYIAKTYTNNIKNHALDNGNWKLASIGESSAIIGVVKEENYCLAYIGGLNGPFPNWPHSESPMDSPHTTAAYLLQHYKQKGCACFAEIYGQYAIIIYDNIKKTASLISDTSGLRTLFYTTKGNEILFCNNLATLAASTDNVEINRGYEDFLLIYGFYPHGQTVYKDINMLAPGNILSWSTETIESTELNPIDPWRAKYSKENIEKMSEPELVDACYDTFIRALEEQTASTKKTAVLLGGFDSALVASGLKKLGKEVETFSFYYENDEFNQPHTDTLAEYLDIKHSWVKITDNVIERGLQEYSSVFNFPTNWVNYVVQTEEVCKVMKARGFDYIYSGDGCDGVFMGYPRTHILAEIYSKIGTLPEYALRILLSVLKPNSIEKLLGRPYTIILNLVRGLGRTGAERGHLNFRIFDEISLARLRKHPIEQLYSVKSLTKELSSLVEGMSPDRRAYQGKALVSPNKSKMIGSSDSTGVIINSPYLHAGLKTFALNLPDSALRPSKNSTSDEEHADMNGKYILCKMAEEKSLLPREIIYQKKISAVVGPIDSWYFGSIKQSIIDELRFLPFEYDMNYVNQLLTPKAIENLYKSKISSDTITTHDVSLLASYASFCKSSSHPNPA